MWKIGKRGRLKTHIKNKVSRKEYLIHSEAYRIAKKYGDIINVPRILSYDEKKQQMTTVKVGKENVSDYYGEEFSSVPEEVTEKIRNIIQILYDSGIIYPDITGYNFIESRRSKNKRVWIFDFEHAEILPKKPNDFVEEFLGGLNDWNPDFR